jgi:hypothetical protein
MYKIKTIKLSKTGWYSGYIGLDDIHKAIKERKLDKKSFWKPIADETFDEAHKLGFGFGGIKYAIDSSKTFSQLKGEIEHGTGHWLAPVAIGYEKYGKLLTKKIGKVIKVRVIEV